MLVDLIENLFSVRAIKKSRSEYAFPCPGCGGEDRFIVWPKQKRYWCRQCSRNGDEIQLLRDFKGMSYREACAYLNLKPMHQQSNQAVRRQTSDWEPKHYGPRNEKWRARASELLENATSALAKSPEQLKYLKGRGIDDQTIEMFRLGYMKTTVFESRISWGLDNSQKTSILIPEGIIIPYFIDEKICRIRIRQSNPQGANRYVLASGSSSQPFIAPVKLALPLLIVESELCAILLYQEAGDLANIAATGSASYRPDVILDKLIMDTDQVLYSLDFDDAGKGEFKWWKHQYPKICPLPTVQGADPTESFQNGVVLREWLKCGLALA